MKTTYLYLSFAAGEQDFKPPAAAAAAAAAATAELSLFSVPSVSPTQNAHTRVEWYLPAAAPCNKWHLQWLRKNAQAILQTGEAAAAAEAAARAAAAATAAAR